MDNFNKRHRLWLCAPQQTFQSMMDNTEEGSPIRLQWT